LTSHLERTVVSEKMIEDDLNRVEESETKSTYKGEKSALMFVPSSNYHKEEETLKSTKTHYPSNPKPSFNPKREVSKETPKPREEAFICMFYRRAGPLYEFCFYRKRIEKMCFNYARNSYVMSLLIFLLIFHLVLRLISFMDLIIAHIVLVHERIALCLYAFVTAHVLIMVIVPNVGTVFLLEGLTLTLSQDTWTVHVFLVMVHVPLAQMVRCKRL
jgi:hypothetical protein